MTDPWRQRVELADGRATLYLGDCLEALPTIGPVDHIIADPPYSARTHKGHDAIAAKDGRGFSYSEQQNRALGYAAWDVPEVDDFADAATAATQGWIVWMCDHVLAVPIQDAMEARGRYAFAPLPYYAPGSRVRLSGDGPSAWTVWIVVARTRALHTWGTLPGGYLRQPGWDAPEKMGGKPVALMERIVMDYSRHGELVCDPCMGRGSTALACLNTGRQFIGIEKDPAEFDAACERIDAASRQGQLFGGAA